MNRRMGEDVDTRFGASPDTRNPVDISLVHIIRPRESCSKSRGPSNLIEPRANRAQRTITTTVKPRANTTCHTTCLLMSAPSLPSTQVLQAPLWPFRVSDLD